jgi:HSP20 family protein
MYSSFTSYATENVVCPLLSQEKKDKHYHTIERRSGSFYRALRLPVGVESDKIDANFKDGVLTLTLPKSKAAAKKVAQIEIK